MDVALVHRRWGARLKTAREAAGLTQVQLAARAGIKQHTLSRWESGERAPSDLMKLVMAEALGIDLNELFGWPALEEVA